MSSRLNFSDGLHESILNGDGDITPGIAFAELSEGFEIGRVKIAGGGADGELKEFHSTGQIGETDVNTTLKPTSDGRVQLPGDVGGAEDQNAARIVTDAVHLNQEFRLDSSRRFRFAFAPWSAERVDFVNEDDRRFVLPRHIE